MMMMPLNEESKLKAAKVLWDAVEFLQSYKPDETNFERWEDCLKILAITDEMDAIMNTHTLDDDEQKDLSKSLKSVIRPRYNNYKNGTKSKGKILKESATLKLHYDNEVDTKVAAMCDSMKNGRSILCSGVSSESEKTGDLCLWSHTLDPHDLHMERFILDHWYEQDKINKTMRECIDRICVSEDYSEGRGDLTSTYIVKYFHDPCKTTVQKTIMNYLDIHLDLELYRDDLYGDNLVMRCHECNKLSKSPTKHPKPEVDRYIRPRDQ